MDLSACWHELVVKAIYRRVGPSSSTLFPVASLVSAIPSHDDLSEPGRISTPFRILRVFLSRVNQYLIPLSLSLFVSYSLSLYVSYSFSLSLSMSLILSLSLSLSFFLSHSPPLSLSSIWIWAFPKILIEMRIFLNTPFSFWSRRYLWLFLYKSMDDVFATSPQRPSWGRWRWVVGICCCQWGPSDHLTISDFNILGMSPAVLRGQSHHDITIDG